MINKKHLGIGLFTIFMCSGLIAHTPSVQAQTPDGETPAVEDVCDPVKDATPGLYGLCIAIMFFCFTTPSALYLEASFFSF